MTALKIKQPPPHSDTQIPPASDEISVIQPISEEEVAQTIYTLFPMALLAGLMALTSTPEGLVVSLQSYESDGLSLRARLRVDHGVDHGYRDSKERGGT